MSVDFAVGGVASPSPRFSSAEDLTMDFLGFTRFEDLTTGMKR